MGWEGESCWGHTTLLNSSFWHEFPGVVRGSSREEERHPSTAQAKENPLRNRTSEPTYKLHRSSSLAGDSAMGGKEASLHI